MFIELHLIQNFAPSNLNRDDTGNPKDTDFGGVRRARISSQAIKRAIRQESIFSDMTKAPLGKRTKEMAKPIKKRLIALEKDPELSETIALAYAGAYVTKKKDRNNGINKYLGNIEEGKTTVLTFVTEEEFDIVAQLLIENWDEVVSEVTDRGSKILGKLVKALIDSTKGRTSAPDIALYGRMLASDPATNINAACQVAHAISTHRVNMDMDFFTAVDDLQSEEETGSSHMGVTAFNSACFYRYARIDFKLLVKNLDGNEELALKTVKGFLRSALRAIPTGKQNSFAAQNPPSFALAVTRKDGMSWSLANAFEKPVRTAHEGGFVKNSIEAADKYWAKLSKIYGDEGIETFTLNLEDDMTLSALKGSERDSENDWLEGILAELNPQEG